MYLPVLRTTSLLTLTFRELYRFIRFFHGFARHSDAVELLKGKPGYFLVRYSESQLKDGFFAFNVNKGMYPLPVKQNSY